MNKVKIATVLVILCIFSSLITSIVKAQDKITLNADIIEIDNNIEIVDLTCMKAELVTEEIIVDNNTIENEENTIIQSTNNEITTTQEQEVADNNIINMEDDNSTECEVVIIPSNTGIIEIEEIIEYSKE